MKDKEFLESWAVLTAALGFPVPSATAAFYGQRLGGLADGTFSAGIANLVESPEFVEFVQYRRLPTLHELRAVCRETARAPRGRPYVGGVPLPELLGAIPEDSRQPFPEECEDLVGRVAAKAGPARILPGPGAVLARIPRTGLSAEEWEANRRRLLELAGE